MKMWTVIEMKSLLILICLLVLKVPCVYAADYELRLSYTPDLSTSEPLADANVSGTIYVFTTPDDDVREVLFYINGELATTERYAPYELAGGYGYNTKLLSPGKNGIKAVIPLTNGDVVTLTETIHKVIYTRIPTVKGFIIVRDK